jgi:hypothetical protein
MRAIHAICFRLRIILRYNSRLLPPTESMYSSVVFSFRITVDSAVCMVHTEVSTLTNDILHNCTTGQNTGIHNYSYMQKSNE